MGLAVGSLMIRNLNTDGDHVMFGLVLKSLLEERLLEGIQINIGIRKD